MISDSRSVHDLAGVVVKQVSIQNMKFNDGVALGDCQVIHITHVEDVKWQWIDSAGFGWNYHYDPCDLVVGKQHIP